MGCNEQEIIALTLAQMFQSPCGDWTATVHTRIYSRGDGVSITLRCVGCSRKEMLTINNALMFQSPCGEWAATDKDNSKDNSKTVQSPCGERAATWLIVNLQKCSRFNHLAVAGCNDGVRPLPVREYGSITLRCVGCNFISIIVQYFGFGFNHLAVIAVTRNQDCKPLDEPVSITLR